MFFGTQLSLFEKVFVDDLSNTKQMFGLYIPQLAEVTLHESTNSEGRLGSKE
jgi:hypothetical protein